MTVLFEYAPLVLGNDTRLFASPSSGFEPFHHAPPEISLTSFRPQPPADGTLAAFAIAFIAGQITSSAALDADRNVATEEPNSGCPDQPAVKAASDQSADDPSGFGQTTSRVVAVICFPGPPPAP